MWARFYLNDLRIIAHYLGSLIVLLACMMLVPLLVALASQEWRPVAQYTCGFGLCFASGSLLKLAKVNPGQMERRQAIAITGLVWVVGAFFAAVPLYASGQFASFLDAFFECVSGLTATGLTMARDLNHISNADQMWRFTLQFLGGQGVIVIAVSLGIFTRSSGALYASEGRDESVLPSIKKTAQFIWRFSAGVVCVGTLLLAVVLALQGLSPFRSFLHSLWITIGAYDTGGFAPQSLSITYYHSLPLEVFVMFLMCLGALNFALLAQVHQGNWRAILSDIETRTLALWITGMVVIFVAALMAGNYLLDNASLLRMGVFTIVSATTNTGYQLLSTSQLTTALTSGAFFLIAIAMSIGGSAGSTAGGIKALRVGLIFKGVTARIKAVLLPQSAQVTTTYQHVGRHTLSAELLSSVLIIAALYVVSYVIGALAGIAFGYEALPAIFESISTTSNAGLSSGLTSPQIPEALKVVYIFQMWMGRLEFITLLALIASFVASLKPRHKTTAFVRERRER